MPSYIIFSFLAATLFALSNLTNKFASKHKISNPWVMFFYSCIAFIPSLIIIPLFFDVSIPTTGWQYIFLFSLFFFTGHIFFISALYKLDASTFAPFFQLQSVFVLILAFLFLGERFPAQSYIYILIMIVGSILVSLDEKISLKSYFRLAILLIISMQFFHAISNLFVGFALKSMNSFTAIFWGDITTIFLALLTIPFIKVKNLKTITFPKFKPLIFAGFFSVFGAASLFSAFQTNITISSVIALLTSPLVLAFSIIISIIKPNFLEQHTTKVYIIRSIGVLLILIGAIKLSIT